MSKKRHKSMRVIALSAIAIVSSALWLLGRLNPTVRKKLLKKSEQNMHGLFKALHLYFLPHADNGYKPHVFQRKSVGHILLLVVVVKVALITILFTLYPNQARLTSDVISEMYRLVNAYRGEQQVAELSVEPYLETAAMNKANDMLANNYFSHYGVDGKKPWEWIDTSQYDFKAMGENLAMDFLTAGSVFHAFQQSPTHDRNLLQSEYDNVGIAIVNGYLDGHNTNVMVVFFGSRKSKPIIPIPVAQAETLPADSTETVIENPPVTQEKPVQESAPVAPAPAEPAATTVSVTENTSETTPETAAAPETQDSGRTILIERVDEPVATQIAGADLNDRFIVAENFRTGSAFSQGTLTQRIIAWTDRFLLGVLIALILLLVVNIFVRIEIQHKSVIANAVFLIVVVSLALYANVHQAEALGEKVRILSYLFLV